MAITMNDCRQADDHDYKGLSTDQKPVEDVAINALFLELDTGDFYYFTGDENTPWAKVGGAA